MTGPIMPKGKGSGGSTVLLETVKSSSAPSKGKKNHQNNANPARQHNQTSKHQQGPNNSRKRTISGQGKKVGQDNNANNRKQQGPAAVGPASLMHNANSRYGRGGRNFSGPPNPPPDLLTPTVPPLYPSASAPVSLKTSSVDKVKVYRRFCRYYKSNYKIKVPKFNKSAFHVERYTDMYKAPLTVNSEIVHKIHSVRIPGELSSNCPFKKPRRPKVVSAKIKVVDLEDDEEKPAEGGAEKTKKTNEEDAEATGEVLEEEEMEDGDDELDMGTDYVSSYFDNGEGFLDSDHDGDEDGAIY